MWSPIAKVYDPLKAGSIDGTDTEPHDRGIVRAMNATYTPSRNTTGKPECTIFVARLDRRTTEESLRHVFCTYGRILKCTVVRDIVTGASKGYAFIQYERESSANEAYYRSPHILIDDRKILVDYECERLLPGWIPRRLGGGFGGRKESGQLRFGRRERPFRKPILPLIKKHPDAHRRDQHEDDHRYKAHSHKSSHGTPERRK